MAVSARDVARMAGVSVSTVSRTLARPDQVAPETRDKVVAAARALGYRANPAARSLITGQTGTLGLVVPDLENPYFTSVTKGVQKRAQAAGYALLVADSDEHSGQEAELVRNMASRVDGTVLCSPRASDDVIAGLAQEFRLVLVNRRVGDIPAITVDNADGVRQALHHLRALGHGRVAYVGGPRDSWSHGERLAAFRSIGAELDLDLVELGNFRPYVSGGVAAADILIASGATAVLAYNDLLALGLLERLRQRGVRVPEDLSVVGVDNVPVAALTSPALTSVEVPRMESGRAAVDLLLAEVREGVHTAGATQDLSVQLVVRGSTGTPAAAGGAAVRHPAGVVTT
ncbi:LacI family DNA-binding transcriptional regulator [Actinotalea ferrariae]|uniref:LacI family DNA-binding transcriptional regulator n=1 Tax=Actinotalea ferrariae TaxID=1386098 RepID=UPI001C8CB28C|nr:LacI family DNA-binding transcriptional regulator [Actinotalea ferrariae]MBX9246351.1 LacI family DNA-binding transcriptional regulator [Actinotalea ferrariae]